MTFREQLEAAKMVLKEPKNPNYAATVVALKDFVELPGCDRIKAALIFGNSVIVGKDAKAGDVGLFFPVETQLSPEFLAANSLYRKSAQTAENPNKDPKASGFFEAHGRIKCVKFRGNKSEGFYIPMSSLDYLDTYLGIIEIGQSFDEVDGHEICRKYVPKHNPARLNKQQERLAKLIDSIVPNQFRFHPDTEQLRRNIHKIHPSDTISISDKWHGTSVVVSKVLTMRPLPWYERLLKLLGVHIQTQQYGVVYSSRKVVKAVAGERNPRAKDFYTTDIWGIVAREIEEKIPLGYTIYGEIVGWVPGGADKLGREIEAQAYAPIQKDYHYGCSPGTHKFVVYRVTCTNADGLVLELSWPQLFDFCAKYGFEMVKEIWYGKAGQLLNYESFSSSVRLPDDQTLTVWQTQLLKQLEGLYVHDQLCEYNNFEVPAEGVVVRIDHLDHAEAFKLKNYAFLERETKELDKGEVDLETVESEELEEAA